MHFNRIRNKGPPGSFYLECPQFCEYRSVRILSREEGGREGEFALEVDDLGLKPASIHPRVQNGNDGLPLTGRLQGDVYA